MLRYARHGARCERPWRHIIRGCSAGVTADSTGRAPDIAAAAGAVAAAGAPTAAAAGAPTAAAAKPVEPCLAHASGRAARVPSFVVMDVMSAAAAREAALARAGRTQSADRVLHLEVGQPASGAPAAVVRAAVAALENATATAGRPLDALGYTVALGEPALRRRIAQMCEDRYGLGRGQGIAVDVLMEHVAVTTGSSGAFVAAFTCLWDAGDRVVCPLPGYPCYRNVLTALGVQPVLLETTAENRYTPTVHELEQLEQRHGRLAGLIVASPSNPTGCIIGRERLEQLAAFCDARGMHFVSDEIYHGISLHLGVTKSFPSALEVYDRAIVVSSFSKYQSMSGWRLGYLVCKDQGIMQSLERLLQNMHISAPTLSQRAALAAFDCAHELDAHVQRYAHNIRLLAKALPPLSFECCQPDGAFYLYTRAAQVFPKVDASSSVDFCRMMLDQIGVAATPGVDFDPIRGHEYVRFSASGSTTDVADACDRLQMWLR